MDNKQNRQFYWEVKQFINGNNTTKAPEVKNPSVKDAISGILSENSVYRQNPFNKNTGTNDVVRSYLDVIANAEKKENPDCVAYTKNKVSNPFNLMEISTFMANAGKMLTGVGMGQVPTDASEEAPEKQQEQPKTQETGGAMRYGRPIPSNVDVSGSFGGQEGAGYPSQREINLKRAGEERLAAEKQRKQREADRAETKRQDELTALLKDTEEKFKDNPDYAKRVRETIEGGEAKTAKDVERELGTEFRQGIRDLRITRERDKRAGQYAEKLYGTFSKAADIKDLSAGEASLLAATKGSIESFGPEFGKAVEDKLSEKIRSIVGKKSTPELKVATNVHEVPDESSPETLIHTGQFGQMLPPSQWRMGPSGTKVVTTQSVYSSTKPEDLTPLDKASMQKATEAERVRERALAFMSGESKDLYKVASEKQAEWRASEKQKEDERRASSRPSSPMSDADKRILAAKTELDRWRSLSHEQKMAEAWKEDMGLLASRPDLATQYPELSAMQKSGQVPDWASGKPRTRR